MTPQQEAALKADILANPTLAAHAANNAYGPIAAHYQGMPTPLDFWVWGTTVSRFDITLQVSASGTSFDFVIFKNQTAAEQGAWSEIFMKSNMADFANAKVRAGISGIFGAANANTTHCFAASRRKANNGEKLFGIETPDVPPAKTGPVGSATNVATMTFEGLIQDGDVQKALQS